MPFTLVNSMVCTGRDRGETLVPSPSCALKLFPHAQTVPSDFIARTKPKLVESSTASTPSTPSTWSGAIARTPSRVVPEIPSPSWPCAPRPQVHTVPSFRTATVWSFPAAIARTLPKNVCATTLLITLALLLAEFGSGRALATEAVACSAVPAAASTLAVMTNGTLPTIVEGEKTLTPPVTVPDEL